jgi:hypothetical protein
MRRRAATRKPVRAKSRVHFVASLILPAQKRIDPGRLAARLRRKLRKTDRFREIESAGRVLQVDVAGGSAMLIQNDTPIPRQEMDDACLRAWHWPGARAAVTGHKANVDIALLNTGLSQLDAALLLTRIVSAAIEETGAAAVYWGTSLQPRDAFLRDAAAASRDRIPVMLWVDFRLSQDAAGSVSLSSHGLEDFGLMEIEAKDAPVAWHELARHAVGMAQYLIANGPVIGDRDTIGSAKAQRIRVRHAPSYWRRGKKTYRLDFAA